MRVPSPGTASSTGGSDDDHDQGFGEYEGTMHSGDRSRFAGYPGHDASFAGHMGGLPILEGLAQEVGGSSVGVSSFASKYLEALARQTDVSTNLPSPSISNPSTPIYPFQLSSHTPGYAYSYFPHMITHPPPRPRSPISRTLNARYNQFWTQNNPFAFVCTSSPRFSSTLHTIFSRYIPPYAETDDMVNHALMAFSAADAEKECSSGEWHRKLNIAGLRHAGKCQRMLGVRLGKLRLGSSEQREEINPMVTDTEITAVKLSIVLMLCYGVSFLHSKYISTSESINIIPQLCIADVSLVRLTTQLLALSKTIPAYSPSTSYVATIPIASTFTEYPGGGFRVRLYLDKSHSGNEQEEPGMILGHDIHPFKQLRTEFEKQFRTETYLQLLMEDCEDDGEEEGEDGEGGDDASGSGIVHDAMEPITREVKPRPEMLRLTTTLSGHGMNTRQSIITPTSATTPSLAVSSFSGLGHPSGSNLEYSTSVGTFGIAPHPIAHSHHPPASGINASAPPMGLNGSGYMYMPAGSTGSYQSVSPQLPPQHTLSTSNEDNCRMIHMQLHRNMDI